MNRYRRFLERLEERRSKRVTDEEHRFPIALFAIASVSLCGLFHQLFTALPAEAASGAVAPETIAGRIADVSARLGEIPFISLGAFALAIAPGLLRPLSARRYFVGLALVTLGVWALCFVASEEPAKRLGEALHGLASERVLPDPLAK